MHSPRPVEEIPLVRDGHGFELRMAVQLQEEVADMVAHRRLREAELDRDLPGRDAVCEQLQHFVLAWTQAPGGCLSPTTRGRGAAGRQDMSPLHLGTKHESADRRTHDE